MKRILLIALSIFTSIICGAQQEKKPTTMILPSSHWCDTRYFTTNFDNQGKRTIINDYELAFRQDSELPKVTAKIGQLLSKYGFQVKDYTHEIQAINDRYAEDEVTMSHNGGSLTETPLDVLRRTVKYDIEISVDWDVIRSGAQNAISMTIEAFDSYTNKRIATATGTSEPSSDIIDKQIEDAISKQLPPFAKQMDKFFNDLKKNGREIRLTVRVFDTSEYDLETEFGNTELIDSIQDWLADNTVNSVFNLSASTESRADFEQVKIPFFDERGRAMDARSFAVSLRKYLGGSPFNFPCKIMNRGLGEAVIIIGDK